MNEEFETYDNTRSQEPQNGQPAGNAYNMSQGYGYSNGNTYNAPYNNQAPYNYPDNNQPPRQSSGLSIASLVLGIVGIVACCIPIIGIPVNVTGLILGIVGMKKGGRGMAIAGIILCSIFLVLTIANSALGVYINMNYRDAYDFLDSLGIDYNY